MRKDVQLAAHCPEYVRFNWGAKQTFASTSGSSTSAQSGRIWIAFTVHLGTIGWSVMVALFDKIRTQCVFVNPHSSRRDWHTLFSWTLPSLAGDITHHLTATCFCYFSTRTLIKTGLIEKHMTVICTRNYSRNSTFVAEKTGTCRTVVEALSHTNCIEEFAVVLGKRILSTINIHKYLVSGFFVLLTAVSIPRSF